MNISILTLFPDLYTSFLKTSLIGRAQEQKHIQCHVENMFSYTSSKERIDGPTFGHGAGVLLRPEIVEKAIETQENLHGKAFKIFFSPQGKKLDQNLLKIIYEKALERNHLLLVASRYEGMDARVEEYYADLEVSVGDFVLMGGDLPLMVLLEGFLRLVPGVVGKQESVEHESFSGPFVDYPEYTAPVVWKDMTVPEVVRSGNHKQLEEWRRQQAASKTVRTHFEWLRSHIEKKEDILLASNFIPAHYVALMHEHVRVPGTEDGTTSVTSIDIHDIARSSATYGLKHYFIVTPLKDQQLIVQKLLNFWHEGPGIEYNNQRHGAVKQVSLRSSLEEVMQTIQEREGKKPILIATSARSVQPERSITYYDQAKVWDLDRPVLFILGTGRGLCSELLEHCDFVLTPIQGFSSFNHLSVRSAAAIIFDRWLGIDIKNTSYN